MAPVDGLYVAYTAVAKVRQSVAAYKRKRHPVGIIGAGAHELAVYDAGAGKRCGLIHGHDKARRPATGIWLVGIAYVACHVERHCCRLGYVQIQVCTIVKPIVLIAIVVVLVELLEQPTLCHHSCRDEITQVFRAAAHVNAVLGLQSNVFHYVVGPLHARKAYGVAAVLELLQHRVGKHRRKLSPARRIKIVELHLVVELCVAIAAGLFNHLCRSQGRERRRYVNLCLSLCSALRSDEHHAVGSAHSEHGSCRGILQHSDAFDVFRVDV